MTRRRLTLCAAVAALLLAWRSAAIAGTPAPPPLAASIPDGAGGTIVVWEEFRSATNYDIYAQKLNAAGVTQWATGGVVVCAAADRQQSPQLVSDGAGGAIVAWLDSRSGAVHVYAQRVNAAGAPQWTPDGVALCTAANSESGAQITSDGAGGAIVVWEDGRGSSHDIYARRVDAAGVPQWTPDGVALCTAARDQVTPQVASDGAGGAIVTWSDNRFIADYDIFAQRVSAAGAPLWDPDGVALCVVTENQNHPRLASDGAGGAIVVWEDHRNTIDYDIYVQAIDAAGVPQWTGDGVSLCAAGHDQLNPRIASDGAGGAIATWEDYRIGSFSESDVYARRVNSAGAQLWTPDGAALCTAPRGQTSPQILPVGAGGAIVAWEDARGGPNRDIYAQQVDSSGVVVWTANGAALCTAAGDQFGPQIGSDGAGGAVVSWTDERSTTDDDIYAQRVSGGGVQWTSDGVGVHIEPGVQRLPAACSDGGTGVLVAWQEKRGANYDIMLRRFDSGGNALWPAAVVTGVLNAQVNAAIAPDGSGGAIIAWVDYRNGTDADIYAQRVSAAGAPLWAAGGVALCITTGDQVSPQLVADGSGGAVVAWADFRTGADYDIYARRVDGSGVAQWLDDGVVLCAASGNQTGPQLVSDGAGGAIVTWQDSRSSGTQASDVYVQRVDGTGASRWTVDGVALCAATGVQRFPRITPDGAGGAIVAWEDRRGSSADIFARRVNAAGAPLWTVDGVALCTALGAQDSPQLVPDGAGGAIVCWRDGRGGSNLDVYARRVNAAGAPQWTPDGVALCTAAGLQDRPRIVSDGAGGAIIAWEDHRNAGTDTDIYARRVDAGGVPQWTADGVALCTASGPQAFPAIATDGAGGAFVAWADRRDGIEDFVYAQRIDAGGAPAFASDGITPALVSLVGVTASPDRVRIVWYVADTGVRATVYRTSDGAGWSAIGESLADGTGRIRYEDDRVAPGGRYGYRLGVREGGTEWLSAATWVDVPRAAALALRGVSPDPAVDEIWVSFSLPGASPATLSLFDVAGRRARTREVGGMGAGEWRVNLSDGKPLPAGVYVVRLTQGGVALTRSLTVIR